jgi:hypothetical protein
MLPIRRSAKVPDTTIYYSRCKNTGTSGTCNCFPTVVESLANRKRLDNRSKNIHRFQTRCFLHFFSERISQGTLT